MADDLSSEIAYAFAFKEDDCGFNGDATQSTYGGIVGARKALLNVDGTIGNILGLQVATGTGYASSYGAIVLGDFNGVVARLPEYADGIDAKWYVSKFFWGSVMQKLAMAAGGNRVAEIQDGSLRKMFCGYEVVVSQAMPKTPAVSQVCALFGNLRMAARQQRSSHGNAVDQRRCPECFRARRDCDSRHGAVRHQRAPDVGQSSANSALDQTTGIKLAGPIVGLITASS